MVECNIVYLDYHGLKVKHVYGSLTYLMNTVSPPTYYNFPITQVFWVCSSKAWRPLAAVNVNSNRPMMTSSNRNIFRVTVPLCGDLTGQRWIPLTKASDAELWCVLWPAPEKNGGVNNRDAGDLRRHLAHYDVSIMLTVAKIVTSLWNGRSLNLPEISIFGIDCPMPNARGLRNIWR